MINLNDFFDVHRELEFLRRQAISDYWRSTRTDDVILQFTIQQVNYLVTIDRFGPCSLQTIMLNTGMSSSAISAAIDKMVKAGIVDRVQNEDNRREVLVSLTPAFKCALNRIDEHFRNRILDVLSGCTEKELAVIANGAKILLGKLANAAPIN